MVLCQSWQKPLRTKQKGNAVAVLPNQQVEQKREFARASSALKRYDTEVWSYIVGSCKERPEQNLSSNSE